MAETNAETMAERMGSLRIAVTMGDAAGVGPELCLRLLKEPAALEAAVPLVFGDAALLKRVARACGLAEPDRVMAAEEFARGAEPAGPAVVDFGLLEAEAVRPGEVQPECGRAAYHYIEAAVRAAQEGRVAAIATAPINKEALRAAGVPYPGHTEMLAALTGAGRVCMMLASKELTVSMVTGHIGLNQVPGALSVERVREVIELTAEAMKRLGRKAPRLGVCGLNPHAGERGLFGDKEEERFIEPAIGAARQAGIEVEGPVPPDTAFVPERRRRWDAIVCMYHDQGHIPFKMLAFDTGVNITLGLPVVRVSVDHGTAFDIAWQGRAGARSMIEAVRWAARLGGARDSERKS